MTPLPRILSGLPGHAQASDSFRRPLAWRPVGVVLAVDAALFLLTLTHYGYHRDELYFRLLSLHPAWGYVDQSPMTPMIIRAGIWVFGDNLWALRVPAMLCALGAVTLTALLAAELGGGGRAQLLAAAGISSTFVFIAGHILLTASPDLLAWLGFHPFRLPGAAARPAAVVAARRSGGWAGDVQQMVDCAVAGRSPRRPAPRRAAQGSHATLALGRRPCRGGCRRAEPHLPGKHGMA